MIARLMMICGGLKIMPIVRTSGRLPVGRGGMRGIEVGRREQALGVGVEATSGEGSGRRLLNERAMVQDADAIAHITDEREVMRDKQHGEAVAIFEVNQQVDDLGANGQIEGGYDLIAD